MPPSDAFTPSIAPDTISMSSGLTSTVMRSRSTIPRSAPWTASTTRSGSTASVPARIFDASARPSSTARRSSASAAVGLLGPHRFDGAAERGQRRLQRGHRLGMAGGVALGPRGLAQRVGLGPRLGQDVHDGRGLVGRGDRRSDRLQRLEVELGDDAI